MVVHTDGDMQQARLLRTKHALVDAVRADRQIVVKVHGTPVERRRQVGRQAQCERVRAALAWGQHDVDAEHRRRSRVCRQRAAHQCACLDVGQRRAGAHVPRRVRRPRSGGRGEEERRDGRHRRDVRGTQILAHAALKVNRSSLELGVVPELATTEHARRACGICRRRRRAGRQFSAREAQAECVELGVPRHASV